MSRLPMGIVEMGKREGMAWLGCGAAVLASAYLGWLLFGHWPDTGYFEARHEALTQPLYIGFNAVIFAVVAMQRWRPHEPLADERDQRIEGQAAKYGFYALALLNVVAGVALLGDPGLPARLGVEWMRYCLLWMVMLALVVFTGYQLYRYRRG